MTDKPIEVKGSRTEDLYCDQCRKITTHTIVNLRLPYCTECGKHWTPITALPEGEDNG